MWLSWKSGCLQKFILNIFLLSTVMKGQKLRKRGREWPFLKIVNYYPFTNLLLSNIEIFSRGQFSISIISLDYPSYLLDQSSAFLLLFKCCLYLASMAPLNLIQSSDLSLDLFRRLRLVDIQKIVPNQKSSFQYSYCNIQKDI